MNDSVRVEGLDEVIAAFQNGKKTVHEVGKRYIRDWSMYGVREVQRFTLNAGAADTNELIQGINYHIDDTMTGLESTIKPSDKADKYAAYVEYGTKPHMPPISALQAWADRHGIPVWAVALKIARDGTEPRYMWRDGFESLNKRVDSELDDFAQEIIRKL
jgi:hypothetical protein